MYGISNLLTRQATDADGTPNGRLLDAGLFPDPRGWAADKWKLASPVSHVTAASPPASPTGSRPPWFDTSGAINYMV